MSKENRSFYGLSVSPELQFSYDEEVQLSTLIADEKLEAALDAQIQDRIAFESSHPLEWSDYGFGADCSSFVFD